MQLAHVVIENFRQFERLELDFTDPLGRVRDVCVLVGPNGSGKTTVLDAIAAAMSAATGLISNRQGFVVARRHIVRRGADHARVTCVLRFSASEIEASREIHDRLRRPADEPTRVPAASDVSVSWTYPDPSAAEPMGSWQFDPPDAWTLARARFSVEMALRAGLIENPDTLNRLGRLVMFDQQRTALGKSIRQDVWRIIEGTTDGGRDTAAAERWTTDPRTILVELAVKAQVPGPGDNGFKRIQEEYARVCAPRRIVGPIRDERGALDVQFSDGKNEYGYDGVSSGEAMVLLFLIKMVSERIHNSIVLVDEVELHQHPVWQSRLLYQLPRMGDGNQIIATTHSDYIRNLLPRGAVLGTTEAPKMIELGEIDPGAADADHG